MVEIRAKLMEPYGITDIQNITWRTYYDNDNEIYTGSLNPVISTLIILNLSLNLNLNLNLKSVIHLLET